MHSESCSIIGEQLVAAHTTQHKLQTLVSLSFWGLKDTMHYLMLTLTQSLLPTITPKSSFSPQIVPWSCENQLMCPHVGLKQKLVNTKIANTCADTYRHTYHLNILKDSEKHWLVLGTNTKVVHLGILRKKILKTAFIKKRKKKSCIVRAAWYVRCSPWYN